MTPATTISRLMAGLLGAVALSLTAACATCANVGYDVDLDQPGAEDPLAAIDAWRDEGSPGMGTPPSSGWIVPPIGDAETLTLSNPDDDWAVDVMLTTQGGWVVTAARSNC